MASESDCTTTVYGTILLFLVPQVPKEFHGRGTVPGIVIVAENFQDFGVIHQRLQYIQVLKNQLKTRGYRCQIFIALQTQ